MLWTIIILIVVLILIGIIFRMVINFLKLGWLINLIKITLFLCFILTILFGYFLIKDSIDFKNNFSNSTSTFLLYDHTTLLSGIQFNPKASGQDRFVMISFDVLKDMEKDYEKNKISEIKKENYKLIVFSLETFDDADNYQFEIDNQTNLTNEEAKLIVLSSDAREDFAQLMSAKQNIPIDQMRYRFSLAKQEDIKGYFFASIIDYYFNPKNSKEFIKEIRAEKIKIYDETFLFKSIKYIPEFMADELGITGNENNEKENNQVTGLSINNRKI